MTVTFCQSRKPYFKKQNPSSAAPRNPKGRPFQHSFILYNFYFIYFICHSPIPCPSAVRAAAYLYTRDLSDTVSNPLTIYPSSVCHSLQTRKPYFKKQKPSSAAPRNPKGRPFTHNFILYKYILCISYVIAPPQARAQRGQQLTSILVTYLALC